jgi:type I restriction enzyme S subunit
LEQGAVGATIRGINIFDLKRARIPVPPSGERVQIAKHLVEVTQEIDLIIEKSRRSIDLMREHRSALISAAVTGKIDVREAV